MNEFNQKYWDDRYQEGTTGWDAGAITTPLKSYFDQLKDKKLRILVPGAGNGYEASYLWSNGFAYTHVLDISKNAIDGFRKVALDFPKEHIHQEDFFEHSSNYDLIVEQTFFCALDPVLRKAYVDQVHQRLNIGGRLVGLLWSVPLFEDRPPFGGSLEEYVALFSSHFRIHVMEMAYNSIRPRQGRELFINLSKK